MEVTERQRQLLALCAIRVDGAGVDWSLIAQQAPAWRLEQGGDLSGGSSTWADVAHRAARAAVPGLGHDQLQGNALLTEVEGRPFDVPADGLGNGLAPLPSLLARQHHIFRRTLRHMEGTRRSVISADGVRIGLLTAGSGPELLLVHGGMGTIESWQRVWGSLTGQRRVTAMDRRGRGSSGDAATYELSSEYGDVAAVAAALADEQGGPVDVVGHSIGATCVLGAAALGAPFRRIALYEPPGPQATRNKWPERVSAMVADGQVGRAAFTFLTEIVGLTRSEVEALRDAPGGRDVLPIVAATLPREARALAAADLAAAARQVRQPVLLLLGTASPPWAGEITWELAAALPAATVTELPGIGHEALDGAPDLLVAEVLRFLGGEALPSRPAATAHAAARRE